MQLLHGLGLSVKSFNTQALAPGLCCASVPHELLSQGSLKQAFQVDLAAP